MNMITKLDRQVRCSSVLDDVDLEAVRGGTGEVHDACVRVALGFLYNQAVAGYETNRITKEIGPCL
jgi:hypothetical protein